MVGGGGEGGQCRPADEPLPPLSNSRTLGDANREFLTSNGMRRAAHPREGPPLRLKRLDPTPLSLHHDPRAPATETSGWDSLLREHCYRCHEHCEGRHGHIPAKAAFGAVSVVLTMIRVRFLPLHVDRLLDNLYRTPWSTKRTMRSLD